MAWIAPSSWTMPPVRISDTAKRRIGIALLAALHLAGVATLFATEYGWFGIAMSLAAWVLANALWLVLLRRPSVAAALSLASVAVLIVLSQFKYSILQLTLTFLDFLIIDQDTVAFLLAIFPQLRWKLLVAALICLPLGWMIWRNDLLRVRRTVALAAALLALGGIVAGAKLKPEQPWEPFGGVNHVSNFARSGVTQMSHLLSAHSWIEQEGGGFGLMRASASTTMGAADEGCTPAQKPPHIIMMLDESSFDISAAPGIKVPAGYRDFFKSTDGVQRTFVPEATGGPTWYTEFNVLTGLSSRSFGDLKFYVTRLAAGRITRGLPQALKRCGYRTFTLYPSPGNFLAARSFQTSAGVGHFIDMAQMGAADEAQPDKFYFDRARDLFAREKGEGAPLFMFVYTALNHFPWTSAYRAERTPDWKPPGNTAEVDEYIRRQHMTQADYAEFVARLRRDHPDERFLIVRFGDHQPAISHKLMEPDADAAAVALKLRRADPLYYATYYALDTINFPLRDWSSAPTTLDAAYLPIIVQEAAGLPLDASFAAQKRIMTRCHGVFHACNGGIEARRFNRALVEAGLIKGL